ncbi:MAG: zinc dependent phospholipase C family protein [Bacilli bacterium]|nr:zinc dependent phospholipase C family protein [Bacilli bacterium]
MASSIIHMAVAKEMNKNLKKDESKLLLGSIAPDLSKLVGETKKYSHFLDDNNKVDLNKFLAKYKNYLDDDFVLGYYIHLYTDYLWFKYFITEIDNNDKIKKLDGTIVKLNGEMARLYIYNDYTNLNEKLVDKYKLNLNELNNVEISSIINEIPLDRISLLLEQIKIINENINRPKTFVFNIDNINNFIKTSSELILASLKNI